jgi:hypothetical protein
VVERILGKAEVVSSILTGSTIFPKVENAWCGALSLGVPVAPLLFAERGFDSRRDSVADPDDGAEEKQAKDELKGNNHNSLRDFPLASMN